MAGGKIRKLKLSKTLNPKQNQQPIIKHHKLVEQIIQKAEIKRSDIVLEIGVGLGNFTTKLLEVASGVIAIELDTSRVGDVEKQFQGTPIADRFKVIQGDLLTCDLPYFDVCLANVPYQISSPLLFKLLSHRPFFRSAVFMFQREYAMRLIAQPGDSFYCHLSLNTQLLARASLLMKVGKNNFRPPPKVDSYLVRIIPKKLLPSIKFKEWDKLLQFCFSKKNKTLGAIFRLKSVLTVLEESLKGLQSLQAFENIRLSDDYIDIAAEIAALGESLGNLGINDDERDNMDMEVEDAKGVGRNELKEKVLSVLKQENFEGKRSFNLTEGDFLCLLSSLNDVGIHFC